MATEREVVYRIINDHPDGIPGLFERHGALFHEGLVRFFGSAGQEQAGRLEVLARSVAELLKTGRFDDLEETFYNWIVRITWCIFMDLRMKEEGGKHLDPEIIYTFTERVDVEALPDGARKASESHFESCSFCRGLLEHAKEIPVEIRHAGAEYPEKFEAVIQSALESLR
jgi:hypothetical protein